MERKIRVIVIDDEPIVGKRLKSMLQRRGYEVEAFTDGETALNALAEQRRDIVITDLKMRGIDGMKILETVQKEYPDTKVIIITGVGKWLTATEAFEKGAFDFIVKPFQFEDLENAIKRVETTLSRKGD